MKISEIRNKYRFKSAEEMAAYNADYQEQYEADLAAKKEDLLQCVKLGIKYKKSLAAANADKNTDKKNKAKSITAYKKYAKYVSLLNDPAKWDTDPDSITLADLNKDELEKFAKELLNNRAFSTNANHFGSLAQFNETLPTEWAFYSYEEILAMEADGATIPKEVLAWAHAMEDCNVSGYALDENSIDEIDLNSALSNPDKLEQQVQVLSKQSEDKQKAMDEKAEKLEETAKKAEQIQKSQEDSKGGFLKEINDLTEEYAALSQKMEKGEELTSGEQERLKTLGKLLNGKDGKVTKDVQASSNELQALIDTMDGLIIDIKDSRDLGGKTLDLAKELAKQEKSHGKKYISKGFGVAISTVSDMSIAPQGGEVANIANKNASGLIEFANTLNSQLMMNQYASLYEFAEIFTADADKALGETQDVMGENFDKSGEELAQAPEVAETLKSEDEEYSLKGLQGMFFGGIQLNQRIKENGIQAIIDAEKAIQSIDELKGEQKELLKAGEEIAAEAEQTVASEPSSEDEQAERATIVEGASSEAEEIGATLEAKSEKELTSKEKLDKALKVNEKHEKFNEAAKASPAFNIAFGTGAMAYGFGALIPLGSINISTGSALIAAAQPLLLNPFTAAIGMAMVTMGTQMIIEGSLTVVTGGLIGGTGAILMGIGIQGLDAYTIAAAQIEVSEEELMEAKDILDGKDVNVSEAEQIRRDMVKSGASLPEQAIAFTALSAQEGAKAFKETISTEGIVMNSDAEGTKSELLGKIVKATMTPKRKEYEKLKSEEDEKSKEQEKNTEEQKSRLKLMGIDPEKVTTKKTETTSSSDNKKQARMDKLAKQMETVGTKSQENLYKSLTKIEGLKEFLADKDGIGASAIDIGTVAQLVGADVIENIGFPLFIMLGLAAMAAGAAAETSGENLNTAVSKAVPSIASDAVKVRTAQSRVEQSTMVAAITDAQPEENQENQEVEVINETKNVETVEETKDNKKKSDDDVSLEEGKAQIKEGVKTKSKVDDSSSQGKQITSEAKSDAKASEKTETEAKKDIKKFEQQGKRIQKEIQQDSKKIEKLSEDSIQAVKEQELLAAEYDALEAQNQSAIARIEAKQNTPQTKSAPVTRGFTNNEEPGGLLGPAEVSGGLLSPTQSAQSESVAGDIAIVDANNARIGEISGKFQSLDGRIRKNRVSITKLHAKTSRRIKQFKAIAKQKVKLQKQLQKAEKAKQERIQKKLAIIDLCANVLTLAATVVNILAIIGKILAATAITLASNPFTALLAPAFTAASVSTLTVADVITGALNIASGILQVAKAGVLYANGMSKEATAMLGQAIISIAMSAVSMGMAGGAGQAAGEAVEGVTKTMTAGQKAAAAGQIIGQTANLVSASANIANNASIIQGKGPNKTAQKVAQIAGIVGGLGSLAGGFQGFGDMKAYQQAAQILQTVGQAATSTAQMSTIIKQAQGKNAGEFEAIMGLVGTAASTVGAMTNNIGGMAQTGKDQKLAKQEYETKMKEYNKAKAKGLPVGEAPTMPQLTKSQKIAISQNVFESVGKAVSITAQISAMAKQANSKKAGEFEAIMGLVGSALVTTGGMIGSVAGFVEMAQQAKKTAEAEDQLKSAENEAGNNGTIATDGTKTVTLDDPEADNKLAKQTEEIKETDKKQKQTQAEKREERKAKKAEEDANLTAEERKQRKLKLTYDVLNGAQAAWNPAVEAAFSIAESSKTDSNSKVQNSDNVLKLSNLEKSRALVKKIKRRREVLSSHVRSQKRRA